MRGAGAELLQALDALVGVILDSGDGGHDGGGAEPVRDLREVGEVPLDVGVEDGLGPGVAQGAPVLVQEIHQLFTKEPEKWRALRWVGDRSDLINQLSKPASTNCYRIPD